LKPEIIAAIDVGSHAICMKIGELKENGEFRELENFRKIETLGHDTFNYGKISFKSVEKVCNILKIFKGTMNDYDIKYYKAMATSAIREASNRDYIVDQIKLKTGLDINVIDNSEEQYLIHKAIKHKLDNYERIIEEGAVIVVIGAGSIQITIYKDSNLISSQNVKMGALRIKEVLSTFENETIKYHKILDEYITANFEGLDFFNEDNFCKHFIAVGGEISLIRKVIGIKEENYSFSSLSYEQFISLLKNLSCKSSEEIMENYNVKKERAEVIIPSMMLFEKFIVRTDADVMLIPDISLTDGIIINLFEEMNKPKITSKIYQDIITNAKVFAEKFHYNATHCETVCNNAVILFDELKSIHGLEDEKILLITASILHDIGKYINVNDHHIHSYEIIRSIKLFGMSKEQMILVANIARYHSEDVPKYEDSNFNVLSEEDRLKVAKLVAIIRLADALDRSHKQKITIKSVKVKERKVIIKCLSNQNTQLEEWTFKTKALFFQEVFGITPVLNVKRDL